MVLLIFQFIYPEPGQESKADVKHNGCLAIHNHPGAHKNANKVPGLNQFELMNFLLSKQLVNIE